MDIKVQTISKQWVSASANQSEAFRKFSTGIYDPPHDRYVNENLNINVIHLQQREIPYTYIDECNNSCTIKRDNLYGGIYITQNNCDPIPIADWNNVQIFLHNHPNNVVNWYNARDYQIHGFFDFIHDETKKGINTKKYYKTKRSFIRDTPNIIYKEIDLDGVQPNIIFAISRSSNGTIFFERNDLTRSQFRISDCQIMRDGYISFYHRIIDDGTNAGFVISSNSANSANSANTYLSLPENISIELSTESSNECGICYANKTNIQFTPCNHSDVCSNCYKKLIKPRECPICKSVINRIIKI